MIAFGAAAAITLVAIPFIEHVVGGRVYSTEIGEQRTVALPDGSLLSINTQSLVRVDYSANARSIHLYTGQALFSVVLDSQRPFRVCVDGTVVHKTLGRSSTLGAALRRTSVAVIEGRVQVSSDITHSREGSTLATKVVAGEGLNVLNTGVQTLPRPIDIKQATAWQQRRLVFVNCTLNEIVSEFARYTPMQIRIQDSSIGDLRLQ